jgi:hypothetical protein
VQAELVTAGPAPDVGVSQAPLVEPFDDLFVVLGWDDQCWSGFGVTLANRHPGLPYPESDEQSHATRAAILRRLDSQPVLMPEGTVREILEMDRMAEELRQEIDRRGVEMRRLADEGGRLRRASADLERTLSARVTSQLRTLADRVRYRRS